MKFIVLLLALCLATPSWAQDKNGSYSINADTVDSHNGVTTYKGNVKVEVSNLVIEADTISIFGDGALPSRIEANGNPLRFRREAPADNLSGTAQKIIFSVPELKLTLIDYVVTDPSGNSMKGKQATFVLKR